MHFSETFVDYCGRGRGHFKTPSRETQLQLSIIEANRLIEGTGISSRKDVIVRREGKIVRRIHL